MPVEDHSLEAGDFEGVHEGQARGSGAVIIWDEGPAEILRDEPGHVSFVLHGRKLTGGFALTRTGPRRWILVKTRDDAARPGSDIAAEQPASVRTGRTWQDLARRGLPGPAGREPVRCCAGARPGPPRPVQRGRGRRAAPGHLRPGRFSFRRSAVPDGHGDGAAAGRCSTGR